jgi:hypothetical protein
VVAKYEIRYAYSGGVNVAYCAWGESEEVVVLAGRPDAGHGRPPKPALEGTLGDSTRRDYVPLCVCQAASAISGS